MRFRRHVRAHRVALLSPAELYALRELVHVAVHKTSIAPSETPQGQKPQGDDALKAHDAQCRSLRVDAALSKSRRFYFSKRADERLRLTRKHFVRLFPLLMRASRAARKTLFKAFDADASGRIEFEELCAMLERVKQARAQVKSMAGLVFDWFSGGNEVLMHADVKLMATTVLELGGEVKQEGFDLVASLIKLVLGRGQTQVARQTFCQEMDCTLGEHVLHVLLAPFDVVRAMLDEESTLQEMQSVQWQAGDTAYVLAKSWWTQWRQYVQPGSARKTARPQNDKGSEQVAGEQQAQERRQEAEQHDKPGYCPRPGPIANREISADEHLGTLRAGLVEGEDFVLAPTGVWRRLVQIYGGGPEFPRKIVADESGSMAPREEEDAKPANPATSADEPQEPLETHVELYPIVLQVRLARHDSRHVYLVYARRFLLHRSSSLKEIVHRMGVFPGINAKEVTLWLRQRRLQSWIRLECSLDAPQATLEGLQITSAQELLVDFRAMEIDTDPESEAQQQRRASLDAILPREPFTVSMLQPLGNDFVSCPRSSVEQFNRLGDWKILRESMAAEQEAAAAAAVSTHVGAGGVLVGLAKHMEVSTRKPTRGRLVAHTGLRATGLINMGNTCFMNSALQCFAHSPVFREYFLSHRFEAEVNKKNHLGSRGAVAAAYAQLQSALWRERDQGYLLPGRFRDEFTRVRHHFQETRQYDAHEFMVAFLDCLHEDLNQGCRTLGGTVEDDIQARSSRCLSFGLFSNGGEMDGLPDSSEPANPRSDKAQGEVAWKSHTSVNSSVVVDLFHGQMKSETECATCGERKCTFDPNLFFSLPIPETKFVRVDMTVVLQSRELPGDDNAQAVQTTRQGFWLRRGASVGALCDRIASVNGRASGNRFLLVEVRRSRIKRIVEGDEVVDKLATAVPGSLAAYERAWTLSEIPAVPSSLSEHFGGVREPQSTKSETDETTRSFMELRIGSRVDARDSHNEWHSGTVIETATNDPLEESLSLKKASSKQRRLRVLVHFDAFSSKWDKWFSVRDWIAERLKPIHVHTSKSTEVFEVQVVHRFASPAEDGGQTSGDKRAVTSESSRDRKRSSSGTKVSLNVFGTPLFVTIASDKTAKDMHQALFLQTARFWRGFDAWQQNHSGKQPEDSQQQIKLPYRVRVVNLEDLSSAPGEALPFTDSALLHHFSTRSVLALDWVDSNEYVSQELRAPDDVPFDVADAAKMDPDLRKDLETFASSEQKPKEAEHGVSSDDNSPPMHAVPLAKCMDALLREEAISLEDHWVCERCGVPREGTRRSAIWRLPDLVMVQLKRFQYLENQHKQKVRALVDFPLKGLDFSRWMGRQDQAESSVYDLYAVANHVGGLTRGHYTAYCRYDADFPESSALFTTNDGDVQCPELWFRFDDEKVSEIAPGDVVTDAAYVLFYKRRTLTPSNILRYAL